MGTLGDKGCGWNLQKWLSRVAFVSLALCLCFLGGRSQIEVYSMDTFALGSAIPVPVLRLNQLPVEGSADLDDGMAC